MNNLLCSFWLIDWLWLIILGVILIAFIVVVLILVPFKLWFKAFVSGARIGMFKLISLKLRKLDVGNIVSTYITAHKAGIYIDVDELETHLTAGGHIDLVVNALIMAQSSKVDLSVDTAKAIDLSNRNVVEAVKACINPKMVETENVSCVLKDGFEVKVRFKISLKSNLIKMVGALGEESIISKVMENAVSVVNGYASYADVMANTKEISDILLAKNLDEGNSFRIVGIELCNVELGKDFGAEMRASKIEEERLRANLEAEHERHQVALEEQKMKVKVQEMKAEQVKAEMDLPKALAKSVNEGKLDLMDYYKMQNIIADTDMRKALAKSATETDDKKFVNFNDED